MRQITVHIQSDVFQQIKPAALPAIEKLISDGTKYSPYNFRTSLTINGTPKPDVIWAAHWLRFTNQEVYNLLSKAINIVKDTEEYTNYLLTEMFDDSKHKRYSTPPGTVRFYSNDLICFYNGKTWRKIKP